MKKYELFVIVPGTRTEEEAVKITENLQKLLENAGCQAAASQSLGKNKIAYPIKHIRFGYFYNFVFECEPAVAAEVQKKLRLETDLLRAMIKEYTKTERKPKATTAEVKAENTEAVQRPKEKEETLPTTYNAEQAPASLQTTSTATKGEKVDLSNLDAKIDKILEEEFIKDI